MIRFFDNHKKLENKKEEISGLLMRIAFDNNLSISGLNIIAMSDEELLEMNKKFFNKSDLTDVISFNYNELSEEVDGEIYFSFERTEENSIKYKTTRKEEQARVIVHGFLHITGMNDSSKKEKNEMRRKENHYLKIYVSRETRI